MNIKSTLNFKNIYVQKFYFQSHLIIRIIYIYNIIGENKRLKL